MSTTAVERRGDVAVVSIRHGKRNVLDLERCLELVAVLDSVGASDATAVVLTGNGRTFSAGVDLRRLLDGGPDHTAAFLIALDDCFRTLADVRIPVVAAVDGPALAAGCILAAACDWRLLMARAPIGVTELAVGVPFPPVAFELMRHRVGDRNIGELVYRARLHRGADAVRLGLADEVVEQREQLVPRAVAVSEELARIPADVFADTKAQLRGVRWEAAVAAGMDGVITMVQSPAVRAALERFAAEHLDPA